MAQSAPLQADLLSVFVHYHGLAACCCLDGNSTLACADERSGSDGLAGSRRRLSRAIQAASAA